MRITPGTASLVADESVAFVERTFGFRLPYTPESLLVVDVLIDRIRETGVGADHAAGVLSGLGCYAGEVLVRHVRASWRSPAEMRLGRDCRSAAVLALRDATACDPIGRVFERFSGRDCSVAGLYESLLESPPGATRRQG